MKLTTLYKHYTDYVERYTKTKALLRGEFEKRLRSAKIVRNKKLSKVEYYDYTHQELRKIAEKNIWLDAYDMEDLMEDEPDLVDTEIKDEIDDLKKEILFRPLKPEPVELLKPEPVELDIKDDMIEDLRVRLKAMEKKYDELNDEMAYLVLQETKLSRMKHIEDNIGLDEMIL